MNKANESAGDGLLSTPARLLLSGLESALNAYLRLDPDGPPRATALAGKAIGVELVFTPAGAAGPQLRFYLLPGAEGVQVVDYYPGPPHALIRGTPLALAGQFRGGLGDGMASGVEIQGDAQVAKALQQLLRGVDIDWEEQLSRLVGDVAAHQIGNAVRQLRAWSRQAFATLLQNASEYLQQESRDLPPSGALHAFLDAVDGLRNDVERLEARVVRLRRAHTETPAKRSHSRRRS